MNKKTKSESCKEIGYAGSDDISKTKGRFLLKDGGNDYCKLGVQISLSHDGEVEGGITTSHSAPEVNRITNVSGT